AITLDLRLPDINGWRVLNHLKSELATRHIPVHIISTDDEAPRGLTLGARSVLLKPVTKDCLDGLLDRITRFADRSQRRIALADGVGSAFEELGRYIDTSRIERVSVTKLGELVELFAA